MNKVLSHVLEKNPAGVAELAEGLIGPAIDTSGLDAARFGSAVTKIGHRLQGTTDPVADPDEGKVIGGGLSIAGTLISYFKLGGSEKDLGGVLAALGPKLEARKPKP